MTAYMRTVVLLGLILAAPLPAQAFQDRTDGAAEACSAAAIKAAAAQQIAPQLTGCSIKAVAGPLVRSFQIMPAAREVPGRAAFGTIVSQAPAAGEPLKIKGELALDISTGLPAREPVREEGGGNAASSNTKPDSKPQAETVPARPQTETSAASPSSESASVMTEVTSPPVRAVAPDLMKDVVSTEPARAKTPDLASIWRQIQAYPLYAGLALAALVALAAVMFRPKRPKLKTQAGPPPVSCTLTYGPGRLTALGPLVTGDRRGE